MAQHSASGRGRFITIEGLEGAGKSSQMRRLHGLLAERGIQVTQTREPGGTPFAEKIRALLLATDGETVTPMTELLLMFAARAQHIEQVIEPALAQGHWVLSDRFTDASFAYQGGGRQMGAATVAAVAQLVHPNLTPDLTLYFDLPVEAGQARIANRQLDRLEREAIDFFERVRSTYRERAAAEPARFVLVDAAQDEVSVGADACRILSDAIDRWQTQSG